MKILVVDDSARMRQLIINVIGNSSNTYFECEDGYDALADYIKFNPDLVLMDISMKKLNGLDATAEIINRFPNAQIVIVTNYDDESFRQRAKLSGIKHYVLKENLTQLNEIIKTQYTHVHNKNNIE